MKVIMLICFVVVTVSTAAIERPYYDIENADQFFEDFIKTYNKEYADLTEKQWRFLIFRNKLIDINKKNSDNHAVFAVNSFSDLTSEEFVRQHTGYKPHYLRTAVCKIVYDQNVTTNDAPPSLNWVEKGAVTPAKDQDGCGSCWAFATVGNMEGQYFIKNRNLISFSEQQLLDCSTHGKGCSGGFMPLAIIDTMDIGGLETEESYPYVAKQQKCQFDKTRAVAKIIGCNNYLLKNEDKLKEVLAKKGPIVIGVNGKAVENYAGGILTKDHCSDDIHEINHAVLLVGYGTEDGVDYWLVKNSWGEKWGMKGYFKIHRGDNTCGIVTGHMNCSADV